MSTITIDNISKQFGSLKAADGISFEVNPGEIFGLLGPNGSGKTTTIRILLDIYQPDSGKVSILGGPMSEDKKNLIGYLPEERGLYQDIPLEQGLNYLATLKGLSNAQIKERLPRYLEKFDLSEHRKKKTKDLSKGMQQKAQLIATLIHDPQVIIIDEPFSALDPVNTQLVKDLLIEERNAGKTIIMCTHQMNQVEMLCDRLVLLNHGRVLLTGSLQEVYERFSGHQLYIEASGALPEQIPGVLAIEKHRNGVLLTPAEDISTQELLHELLKANICLNAFEVARPSLDEIFIRVVKEGNDE